LSGEAAARAHVLAVVANIKQFRVPFYQRLAERLSARGIGLRVAYSEPYTTEALKSDSVDLPEPLGLKVARSYMLGGRILLQRVPLSELRHADLVVAVQANGYLLNYPLLLASRLRLKRVALWGHGSNHQGRPGDLRERFRRSLLRLPDWWFAYTERTADHLVGAGMRREHITVINNAVDTTAFASEIAAVTDQELATLRAQLGISPGDPVGLYCGSLYRHKRIPFLLEAAERIRARLPRFVLLVAGAGVETDLVRVAARGPAVRYLGPLYGRNKATLFRLADIFLNPGLVGLAILDSFAAQLPFLTTDIPVHSPEIAYLEPGVSGLLLPHAAETFADSVANLLIDRERLRVMAAAAGHAARRYTLENMVANVGDGIERCLRTTAGTPPVAQSR
jgi:glycosyltransferase involved in cell wall biosynthesis